MNNSYNNTNNNLSIIIATFREAQNIPELISRIAQINFAGRQFEVLIVDDNSCDGTVEVVEKLSRQYAWLKLIVRQHQKGLSRSIIEGFQHAQYPILMAMDADLSHPPEKILEMLAVLSEPGVDFVIGSRYIPGGTIDEIWPLSRKIASKFAAMLARAVLMKRVHDPLSNFIAVKKNQCLTGVPLNPIGWRIGLEIMVKRACQNIREVPIDFSQRKYGVSKLNVKVILSYFQHINQLIFYKMFYERK